MFSPPRFLLDLARSPFPAQVIKARPLRHCGAQPRGSRGAEAVWDSLGDGRA